MSAPRLRVWMGGLLLALVLGLVGGGMWLSKNWPFSREAITRTLERRFARDVVMGSFRETWFPPGCVAYDVQFLHRRHKELPPLITAKNIVVQSSWTGILRRRINKVKLVGLRITIPPADASGESPVMPMTDQKSQLSGVGEMEANDATLVFLPARHEAEPNTVHVHQLVMENIAGNESIPFRVSLKYDRPSGELSASGTLGPWNNDSPRMTSVKGIYEVANADLGTFQNLRGKLNSRGNFSGRLAFLSVEGSVDVPDFHVDGSAHSAHLTTQYRATVDAHTADTVLQKVEARIGHMTISGSGTIEDGESAEGKTARLLLSVNSGRVEDLLNYFSEEKHSSMTGPVRLRAAVEIPPGPGFLKKIRLTGDFGVAGGEFTSLNRQVPINRLSESARGEKKKEQEEDPRTVLSNLKGHVAIRDGVANLTNVSFDFPGASSQMSGTYALIPKTVNIHGTLRTDGTLADASSGFKSVMLRVATPFLKKQHTTVVPFAITGPASHPSIGLDLRHKLKL